MSSSVEIKCVHNAVVPVGELKPHPQNPNRHTETQISILSELIRTLGWRFPIVVSKRSGYIVAGYARLLAAQRLGMEAVPVDYQDFASEIDEITQLLADNRIPEMAERRQEEEAALMARLRQENANLALTGYRSGGHLALRDADPDGGHEGHRDRRYQGQDGQSAGEPGGGRLGNDAG